MIRICKSLPLLLGLLSTISVAVALDKDKPKFAPPDLAKLETKVTNDNVTVGIVAYDTESRAKTAFDKSNPYEEGVLPVLVVIKNEGNTAVKLDRMKVEYIDRDRERIEATPASEVPYLKAPKRPSMSPSPIPGLGRRGPKNPLAAEEIQTRAFAAKMLPPGESAHGFFYFRTGHRTGAKLYLTGLQNAGTGKDLFYFEVAFD